jgi:FMN-dependent NADH-azoreductase
MKILHLTSSLSGDNSFSTKLSTVIVEKLVRNNPDSLVKKYDLGDSPLPHLGVDQIKAFTTPQQDQTIEQSAIYQRAEEAISELFEANIIVFGVPMYNLGIPSTLKAWIDHVARAGRTFRYTESGSEGLVRDKKVYLAIASGSVFSDGKLQDFDFTESYMKSILGLMGVTDVSTFRVEGLGIPGIKENALEKAIETVNEQI